MNLPPEFRFVRDSKPEPGDIIARFSSGAYLEAGPLKRAVITLLKQEGGAAAAAALMTRSGHAMKDWAVRLPTEVARDLAAGMPEDEVERKGHYYVTEMFFYTKAENVPDDDPQWQKIPIAMVAGAADAPSP